jgi:hypothetical protein
MNQRDRFQTEAEYRSWLKQVRSKAGKVKNKNKGFGSHPELAKKYGHKTRKGNKK